MVISRARRVEAAKKAARTRKRNLARLAAEAAKIVARRKRSRAAKRAALSRRRTGVNPVSARKVVRRAVARKVVRRAVARKVVRRRR